ncbi:hypothetical protein AAFF_G00194350 [Aldrovandia affinis]|uniref:Gypsy retrotransposon integrase-like protein 1 n=1 Tax=Aldrovandia affinis TaxID=143900 RepID=A0AAD7WV01_9TELE|nr:hypothetical protein AAFF_G00194350 [Aldrovandia affinis]
MHRQGPLLISVSHQAQRCKTARVGKRNSKQVSLHINPEEERVRAVAKAREPENAADQREKHHYGSDEYVRFVAVSATPKALTTREVEEASATDPELIEARKAITNGRFENCKAYAAVANELCVVGYLVLRGTRDRVTTQLTCTSATLAHEGHLGIVGTKQHLRTKVWWPGMDRKQRRNTAKSVTAAR